ncbi:MAG: DUF1398 family protein [Candidatus Acidiferrales bacterium]
MNTNAIEITLAETEAGRKTFPQCVQELLAVGVESYLVDLARMQKSSYGADGEAHAQKISLPAGPIADRFSHEDLIAAIRGAQRDEIRYPEFVKRARAAGVVAYWAFLTGQRVLYLGRQGEVHVEEFPRAAKL